MIGLYPNLLPPEFKKKLEYPEPLPNLEGSDLEKGLLALTDYLNDVSWFYKTPFLAPSFFYVSILGKTEEDTALIVCSSHFAKIFFIKDIMNDLEHGSFNVKRKSRPPFQIIYQNHIYKTLI